LIAALKPGGFFVGNLPAYDWLASEHDRVVHTRERYTEGRLRKLLFDLDLECVRLSYRLFALFPLIVLSRLPSLLLRSRTSSVSDLRQPSEWLNVVCLRMLQLENRLIARGFSFPWGSSILVVGRKPDQSRREVSVAERGPRSGFASNPRSEGPRSAPFSAPTL
jgi:hypothetical protein